VENDPVALFVTTFIPTILRGGVFAAFGRTAFGGEQKGRPPTGEPNYMRGLRGTPQGYKDFAKNTNDMLGIDTYPETWQTLLESYAVGPLSMLPKSMKKDAKEAQGKELTIKDDPFSAYMFGRFVDARTREQAVDAAFYDHMKDFAKIKAEKFKTDAESKQLVPRPGADVKTWEAYAAEWVRQYDSHKKDDGTATWALAAAQKADYLATLTPPERAKLKSIMPELQKRANAERESFVMMARRIDRMKLEE
jgi:hypothetical protein